MALICLSTSLFFYRTSFPEGASSLPPRDIWPKRQLKPQANKKKKITFLPTTKAEKLNFLKKTSNISTFYNFTFTVQFPFVQFYLSPKQTIKNVKITTSHHTIILHSTVQFTFIQFYLSSMCAIFLI